MPYRPNPGECVLCGATVKLDFGHIIPESLYRLCHDNPLHKQLHTFRRNNPNKTKIIQKGTRDYLMCRAHEDFRDRKYEKPFKSFWIDGKQWEHLNSRTDYILTGIEYHPFKLFHLFILFMAHHAFIDDYSHINIPEKNVDEIRQMLLCGDAGPYSSYQILCTPIDRDDGTIFIDYICVYPMSKYYGQDLVIMMFGGCRWYYFISKILIPCVEHFSLKEDGTLPMVKQPLIDGNIEKPLKFLPPDI